MHANVIACFTFTAILQQALLSAAAGTGSTASGTAAHMHTIDSPFEECFFPDFDAALGHLSKALTFETVSSSTAPNHAVNEAEFKALWAWAADEYSEVFQQLRVEQVGTGSLSRLITWHGSDATLQPVLFVSHVDVVPVTEATVKDWQHPPFGGAIADGHIWGRGAMDIKGAAVALLEAATALLKDGFQPRRTLLIALGHDEEVGGRKGAAEIAALLAGRGTKLAMVWDEGSPVIVGGLMPLVDTPVALVATAEKTYQTVKVTLHSPGGHSSMPATDGSSLAARIGRLLLHIATQQPAAKLVPPTSHFVRGLADIVPIWLKPLLLAVDRVLTLQGLVARVIAGLDHEAAAMVRMTAAVTNIQAGIADNVMPQAGTITINFRLLPGDTSDTIRQQLLHWLGPDAAHAAIAFTDKWETPAAVTDPNGPYFALVKDAIQEAWRLKGPATSAAEQGEKQHAAAAVAASQASRDTQQQQQQQQQKHTQEDMLLKAGHTVGSASSSRAKQLPVIPYLLCGGTDSKWYANLTRNIVRFAPFSVNRRAGDLKRVHGTDERLSVGDFVRMLCTFKAGMKMAGLHMHLGSEAIHTPTVFKSAAAAAAAAVQHSPADSNSGKSMDAEAACSEGLQQAVEGDSSSRAEASGEL